VETTIPSYLVARPARDVVQMARQQITREWWECCRGDHELFTSQIVLDGGILPPDADRDAAHIATATVHRLDALLSLNFRHLVNVSIQSRLRRLAFAAGYDLPAICTPEELMENRE